MNHLFRFIVLILLAAQCGAASSTGVLSPDQKFRGKSRADLSADWWQWAMANPEKNNPVRDVTGDLCGIGQSGDIWFLAGGFGSSHIFRNCKVPAGQHIYFPVINMAYWPEEEGPASFCETARARAAVNNDQALDLFVEVDGIALENPKDYRAATTKCFDIFARVDKSYHPYRAYPAASDGYWILLAPFSKGTHTIKFGGRYNKQSQAYGRMVQDIEYVLTVE